MRTHIAFLACFAAVTLRAAFPYAEATIDGLQQQMAAGQLTAVKLTQAYLDRIAEIDKAGPKLNAIIELNSDALAIAAQLDAERKDGKVRGPLHGIPILIKDNMATADKMETTAGSLALVGSRPPRDAAIVTRLRDAGAVLLGKTNLCEWANARGAKAVIGWSGRGGQTRNPYVLDRSPSGSSSGSAVAVAANLCVVAIGTETYGSIICPASTCGIVGVKPTLGLVSRTGIIPIAASFDTPGPMARSVQDAATVLAILAGTDGQDEATLAAPTGLQSMLSIPVSAQGLRGARIGLVRNQKDRRPLDRAMTDAVRTLRAAGAEVIEVDEFSCRQEARGLAVEAMYYEMKVGLNAYFAMLGQDSRIKSLADVISFNDAHWAEEQPLFGQQHFARAQAKGPLTEPAYGNALAQCRQMSKGWIDGLLDQNRLDALVTIAEAPAGLIKKPEGDDPVLGSQVAVEPGYAAPAMAGYPSVAVPWTDVAGLPVGLLFHGQPWSEPKLLALAADFEAITHARKEPQFLPTLNPK